MYVMSQEKLAAIAGVNESTFSHFEKGTQKVSSIIRKTLEAIVNKWSKTTV